MSNWGTIAFAVRCGSRPDPVFFQDWTRFLLKGIKAGDRVLSPIIEMPQHYAAEFAAKTFLSGPCDAIMFIDDDMSFMPEQVDALRSDPEGQHYDALMGLCLSRNPPHRPLILEKNPNADCTYTIKAVPQKDAIVDAGILGLGFTLIRRELFERVGQVTGDTEMMFQWSPRGDSEDSTFFATALDQGCRLGVSTRVCIGHRVAVTVRWDHDKQGVEYEERDRGLGRTLPEKWYEQEKQLQSGTV